MFRTTDNSSNTVSITKTENNATKMVSGMLAFELGMVIVGELQIDSSNNEQLQLILVLVILVLVTLVLVTLVLVILVLVILVLVTLVLVMLVLRALLLVEIILEGGAHSHSPTTRVWNTYV